MYVFRSNMGMYFSFSRKVFTNSVRSATVFQIADTDENSLIPLPATLLDTVVCDEAFLNRIIA